jgi:hypothetical protein
VLPWDILCVLVDISTRTPYCSTVCLCLNNSLTHSLTEALGRSPRVYTASHVTICRGSAYWASRSVYGFPLETSHMTNLPNTTLCDFSYNGIRILYFRR